MKILSKVHNLVMKSTVFKLKLKIHSLKLKKILSFFMKLKESFIVSKVLRQEHSLSVGTILRIH